MGFNFLFQMWSFLSVFLCRFLVFVIIGGSWDFDLIALFDHQIDSICAHHKLDQKDVLFFLWFNFYVVQMGFLFFFPPSYWLIEFIYCKLK